MSGASVTSRCTPRQKRRQKTPYEADLHHESRSLLFQERRNQCRYKHSKPCTDFMYCWYYILLFHLSTKAEANVATWTDNVFSRFRYKRLQGRFLCTSPRVIFLYSSMNLV